MEGKIYKNSGLNSPIYNVFSIFLSSIPPHRANVIKVACYFMATDNHLLHDR